VIEFVIFCCVTISYVNMPGNYIFGWTSFWVGITNEQALMKIVSLAVEEAARKWMMRHRGWAMIYFQPMIFFEGRLAKYV